MARKKKNKTKQKFKKIFDGLHHETRKSIWIVGFLGATIFFILAGFQQAGPWGNSFYEFLEGLFGYGYYLFPIMTFTLAFSFVDPEEARSLTLSIIGVLLFVISGLGFIDIVSSGAGGLTGSAIGSLENPFGVPASLLITGTILLISFLIVLNKPLNLPKVFSFIKSLKPNFKDIELKSPDTDISIKNQSDDDEEDVEKINLDDEEDKKEEKEEPKEIKNKMEEEDDEEDTDESFSPSAAPTGDYTSPPISLLASKKEKPTIGDLKANANVIKRTLDSFGIQVEMGEVEVGPTVTRYTLKPAEGVKLSKITSLNKDLALALAAHPVRIEAPIPGRSMVGIEVPNESAAMVRLGSLIKSNKFKKSNPLTFVLGRDVSGEPVYVDLTKMPHMLVAGATGSGKSITVHSIITSLLFKNSPESMRMILVDPKRVELSAYEDMPHLVTPVITENKKALSALKWAIDEMERRYETLLDAGARDIESYNKKAKGHMPYIVIVMDELADLMSSHGKAVEGAIVRLAQMSRATGIHLILSTQRPSVEVITGLIKANIPARIGLQVTSQVDSRTILDQGGAEKLLGNGDLLFLSAESSEPRRIQGAFIEEEEINKVASFIKDNNQTEEKDLELDKKEDKSSGKVDLDSYTSDEDKDDLYPEAVQVIKKAGKGSASLLQRRLSIGYARAARILDQMQEEELVGPAQGSKAREVYEENFETKDEGDEESEEN